MIGRSSDSGLLESYDSSDLVGMEVRFGRSSFVL